MPKRTKAYFPALVFALFCCFTASAQYFVQNKGQWDQRAKYRLPMHFGNIYLEQQGLRIQLSDPEGPAFVYHQHQHEGKHCASTHATGKLQKTHTYRMYWPGSNAQAALVPGNTLIAYHNYLLGNDPGRWQRKVPLFREIRYKKVYPGIDVRLYFNEESHLKYDVEIEAGADHRLFKTIYQGVDSLYVYEGNLHILTSTGEIQELRPYAYQRIKGKQVEVACAYVLNGKTVQFKLGKYKPRYKLIIDPKLVFSTYVGSTSNTFGFTATPGKDGSIYGGGIIFGTPTTAYPTVGAVVDTFSGGDFDIGISKFSPDGTKLIYSTYLGGESNEMPYSLIEDSEGSLFIFGNTGSRNFPISNNAAQDTFSGGPTFEYTTDSFANGVDLFITKLDSSGGILLGSTYLGGTGEDGINATYQSSYFNDQFRGEIILDEAGNCYIACNSKSEDFPITIGASQTGIVQNSSALIASLDSDLSAYRWARLFGGDGNDKAFSLRIHQSRVVVTGGTNSSDLPVDPNTTGTGPRGTIGQFDGFLLVLDKTDGQYITSTYTGGNGRDENMFVDVDQQGNIYTFGKSNSQIPTSDLRFFNQPNGHQLIQKFSPDLNQVLRSTKFGTGRAGDLFSPAAFEVDQCQNILLSGWGNDTGLVVTPNAIKKNSSDRDFYFFILDQSWQKVNYASYFGSTNSNPNIGEHIDGGTSRFAEDGTIYQGVCASCRSANAFPTTPNAYASTNAAYPSNNAACNLAVLKFSTDAQEVKAQVTPARDTVCQFTTVNLIDSSYNADTYILTTPDGVRIPLDYLSNVVVPKLGLNTYYITALDTSCGGSDSVEIDIYGIDFSDHAGFTPVYDSCEVSDSALSVRFRPDFNGGFYRAWDFGDGNTSSQIAPLHTYANEGEYTVTLTVYTNACPDTIRESKTIRLHQLSPPEPRIFSNQCTGTIVNFNAGGEGYQFYYWQFPDGGRDTGQAIEKDFFKNEGQYLIRLVAVDTLCNRQDTLEKTFEFSYVEKHFDYPNVFTPNNDGINDQFGLLGDVDEADFAEYSLEIFNRWGQLVYSTTDPGARWNGQQHSEVLAAGVYYYVATYLSACDLSESKKGFVHLIR